MTTALSGRSAPSDLMLRSGITRYFVHTRITSYNVCYTKLLRITDQTERRQQMEQSRLEQLRMQVEEQTLYFAIRDTLDAAMIQTQAPLNMLQAALRLEAEPDSRAAKAINTALSYNFV